MRIKSKPSENNKDKVNKLEAEVLALEKKYGFTSFISLDFPRYKELPEEVKLAIIILNKHEGRFIRGYKEI